MYKPSPLSLGSPRASPFRRPESAASQNSRPQSPSSPTPGLRPTTPTLSPTKSFEPRSSSPSKLQNASTPESSAQIPTEDRASSPSITPSRFPTTPSQPSHGLTPDPLLAERIVRPSNKGPDPLAKLPATQVREMREAFQMLDRNNDGLVDRDDISHMLADLGQPSSASDIAAFFPPGAPQAQTLPAFLSSFSTVLAAMSGQQELLNAFAAFDDQDDGEVDVKELRSALLNTAPAPGERTLDGREIDEILAGFTGKKTFGKRSAGRGLQERSDMFKYREWAGGIVASEEPKVEG